MESNDSPEIPDRGETSNVPGLPSGGPKRKQNNNINNKRFVFESGLWHSDTKVSGVLSVCVPSAGWSFQSLMVAEKKDACL